MRPCPDTIAYWTLVDDPTKNRSHYKNKTDRQRCQKRIVLHQKQSAIKFASTHACCESHVAYSSPVCLLDTLYTVPKLPDPTFSFSSYLDSKSCLYLQSSGVRRSVLMLGYTRSGTNTNAVHTPKQSERCVFRNGCDGCLRTR